MVTLNEKEFHYDLLYVKNKITSHYVLITKFASFIRSQLTKHESQIAICKRCFKYYNGEGKYQKLRLHKIHCDNENMKEATFEQFPKAGSKLKFEHHFYSHPLYYVAFVDFESMFVKSEQLSSQSRNSSICKEAKHEVIAYTYYIVSKDNEPYKNPVKYVGEDAAQHFYNNIVKDATDIASTYQQFPHVPQLSREEHQDFEAATHCCICEEAFTNIYNANNVNVEGDGDDDRCEKKGKVIHHCHATNRYLGAAHSTPCNINAQNKFLPVYFHNMSKYDGKFVSLTLDTDMMDVQIIPRSEEEYTSINKKVAQKFSIKFVDSYRFVSTSLRMLVENMPTSQLFHTRRYYPDPEKFEMASQKNYFPYEYLDNTEKLKDRQLPPKEAFYSSLTKSHISETEYAFAQRAWQVMGCETLADYLLEYNIIDVLLLADVFQAFRRLILETYKLDPCYYISLPSLSQDAFLKLTKTEIDLLSDRDMHLMISKAIRGGLTNTICRYREANTTAIPESFDHNKPPSSLLYIDCNNLYGYAMSQKLPKSNFKWYRHTERFTPRNILHIDPDGEESYFLEVDLEFPKETHDFFNQLPPCPELKCTPRSTVKKLLCTLEPKELYVIHLRMLQFCLRHGVVLKKVHRVISFKQEAFMKPYIELNTRMRRDARDKHEKNTWKLAVNSLYGKTIERVEKRLNFNLYVDERKVRKHIASPFFKSCVIFKEELVGIHKYKEKIVLNKPTQIGAAVLELSKLYMFENFYEILPRIFSIPTSPPTRIQFDLLYMDTDSFVLNVFASNVDEFLLRNKDFFDLSNYPKSSALYDPTNENVIGKFKNEVSHAVIRKFIALSSKCYALQLYPEKTIKRAKGVQNCIVEKELTFQDYYNALCNDVTITKKQSLIRSELLRVYTVSQNKIALVARDDKRLFTDDKFQQGLAYGHYKLAENCVADITVFDETTTA